LKIKSFFEECHLLGCYAVWPKNKGHLPFLDLDIYRRSDSSLRHKVYHKPTHTNLYHSPKSHHHPSNKQVILSTLVHRTRALCDEDSLQAKFVFLRDIYKQNGFIDWQIHRALNCHWHLDEPDNKPNLVTFLPFVGTIFNHISRVLAGHNIKSVGLPHMKLSSLLYPVWDHLGLNIPGVYRISGECAESTLGRQVVLWTSG
jgi:hypothetical protein